MDQYLIYTDSSADLPSHIYREYDLRIISMEYVVNGETFVCHTDAADHDAWCDKLFEAQRNGADVHTSQITPFHYIEAWTPELAAGHDILYLCMSSGLTATFDNVQVAAAQLRDEFPERRLILVDSLSATQGQGILTTAALMNREKGMTIEENAAWLTEKRKYMCHRFVVGDLNYLHKGGRVSKAAAVVGTMLNVKPLLIINDEGKLDVVAKVRGEKIAVKKLVNAYKKEQGVPDVPKLIYVGHTSRYEEVKEVVRMVQEVAEEGTIVEPVNLGPIIGAHIGPSFFSICGWGFHRVESN